MVVLMKKNNNKSQNFKRTSNFEKKPVRLGIARGKYNSMSQEEFDSVNKEIWGDLY